MEIARYDLKMSVDFPAREYSANVLVTGTFDREIAIDAVDLTIGSVKFDGVALPFNYDGKVLKAHLVSNEKKGKISIDFKGKVTNLLQGLYYAKDKSGGEIFTTQFEATGARRMFPCFDRPDMKAVFSLAVEVDSDLDVVSNMPAKSTRTNGGRKTVVFDDTPRMSTYLLYVGIGKLERYFEKHKGKEFGLVTLKGRMQNQDHPISASKFALDYFEEYFGIPYPLPKLDVIAVPEFAFGAMENWGAITFREALLVPSSGTSVRMRKRSVEVIAHEIAHQWFGDLVTMKWWNDIWLNESFATFMSIKSTSSRHPEWKYWEYYLMDRGVSSLNGDSLKSSHPISVEVRDPESISQIFDEISYGKGSFVLRMTEKFVGEDKFRDGLREYLPRFIYGNASGIDLWESIEKVSGKPVKKIMGEWTTKQGYPLIRVSRTAGRVRIVQERFLLDGSTDSSFWPVPITVRTHSGEERIFLDGKSVERDGLDFLTFNSGEAGFYRVLYDEEYYHNLSKILPSLSGEEQWGLLNDSFAFLLSGRVGWNQYSRIISLAGNIRDRIIIEEISRQLHLLILIAPDSEKVKTAASGFFSKWIGEFGEPRKDEEEWVSEVRTNLYSSMILVNREFAETLSKRIDGIFHERPELRGPIGLAYAITSNDFVKLYDKYNESNNDEDRQRFIVSMAWLSGKENLTAFINLIRNGEIKRQDFGTSFINLASSIRGREFAFENYQWMVKTIVEVFSGSVTASNVVSTLITFCGLEKGGSINEMLTWTEHFNEVSTGLNKGKEYLKIYEKLRSALLQ